MQSWTVPTCWQHGSLLDDEIADHEGVHSRTEEGANGVCRRANNRFAAQIERRVHHYRNASALAKLPDHFPVKRIDGLFHGLRAGAAVHVSDGGADHFLWLAAGEDEIPLGLGHAHRYLAA